MLDNVTEMLVIPWGCSVHEMAKFWAGLKDGCEIMGWEDAVVDRGLSPDGTVLVFVTFTPRKKAQRFFLDPVESICPLCYSRESHAHLLNDNAGVRISEIRVGMKLSVLISNEPCRIAVARDGTVTNA